MATTVIQVRVDEELKEKATAICDGLGIDLSTAIRMFMKRTVPQNGIPFSMTLPKSDYNTDSTPETVHSTGAK